MKNYGWVNYWLGWVGLVITLVFLMNRQKSLTSNNNGDDNGNKKYSVIEMKVNRSNNNSDSSSRRRNNISIKATVLSTYLYRVHSIHWKNIIYYLFVSECVQWVHIHCSQNLPIFSRLFVCLFACPRFDVLWCILSVCPTFDFWFFGRLFLFALLTSRTK